MQDALMQLVPIWVGTIIGGILFFLIQNKKMLQKRNGTWELEQKKKIHNRYIFYHRNMILRKRFRRIAQRFSSLNCYDIADVEESSVKAFEKAVLGMVAIPIATIALTKDVTFGLLSLLVSYVYYETTVDKAIDKIYFEVLKELSVAIDSIRSKYLENGNIPKAIMECDKGKLLTRNMNGLYEILSSTDKESKLEQFERAEPMPALRELTYACYLYNEKGDNKSANSTSAFADHLTALRQENDKRIIYQRKIQAAFKSAKGITLGGLIAAPFANMFNLAQIPGTAVLIKGMYGSLVMTVLIIVATYAYYVISSYMRPTVVNSVDRVEWIDKLSRNPEMNRILRAIKPKKFKTKYKLKRKLEEAISSKTEDYVYTMKLLASIALFTVTLIFMCLFTILNREYIRNSTGSLGFTASTDYTEKQLIQIKSADETYMTAETKMSDDDAASLVKSRVKGLNATQIENEVTRMSKKWDTVQSLTFKWYFVLVAYIAGIIGWFLPEISLNFRRKLVKFEETEDVLQLQTMMMVLANTNVDTLTALYWLERTSKLHKSVLRYCCHDYTSHPEQAIINLHESVRNVDFERLITKLGSTIYKLSMYDAFSDIVLDKDQALRMLEIVQTETLESKKQSARTLANIPLYIVIFGLFVGPIFILGFTEIGSTLGALG